MMSTNNDEYQIDYNVPEELERRLRYYQLRTREVEKFKDDVTIELSQKARLIGDDLDVGKRCQGTGTISSTGTNITGSNTIFTKELRVADEITVTRLTDPENHTVEKQTRIVTAINSDTALTINTAFEPDLSEQKFDFFNVALITKESTRVGIGTTTPEAKLHVTGDLKLNNSSAIDEISTDTELSDNSDSAVPTEKAVKAYVDARLLDEEIIEKLKALLPFAEKIKELGVLLPIVEIQGSQNLATSASGDYSIEAPGAISYQWTASGQITITGESNAKSITVTAESQPGAGTLTVDVGGQWNSSLTRTLEITVESSSFSDEQTFDCTGEIQTWTVPDSVNSIQIEAWGAQGGSVGDFTGGRGARMRGDFAVNPGDILKILVGQPGTPTKNNNGAGGGGGSFVAKQNQSEEPTPLLVAGGGGGSISSSGDGYNGGDGQVEENGGDSHVIPSGGNGNTAPDCGDSKETQPGKGGSNGCGGGSGQGGGGGSFYGAGADGVPVSGTTQSTGGNAFIEGGNGGTLTGHDDNPEGGFGGGGAGSLQCGGGGGGYSGGGGGGYNWEIGYGNGGGGGSYNTGTNQDNQPGVQEGDGQVIIRW